jgi:hypothetical protein
MRHGLGRQVALDEARIGVAFAKGGNELVGEAALLTVAVVDTAVDLKQRCHGVSPGPWVKERVPLPSCRHLTIDLLDRKDENLDGYYQLDR